MAPQPDHVECDTELPKRTDVVIIGGGIIGASTALFLARRKLRVVLCEKGRIAGEQSSRNWGWCRTVGRDPKELPLAIKSLELWRNLNGVVGSETGFRQTGVMYLCSDEASIERWQKWLKDVEGSGVDAQIINSTETAKLLPGCAKTWRGALYGPSDGVAEPEKVVPAIIRAARREGAIVLSNCAVRAIESEGGRVSEVLTERGPIRCSTVVMSGGVWSRLLFRTIGLQVPMLKVLGSAMRTEPVHGPLPGGWAQGLSFRKRLDGGYTVSQAVGVHDIVPDSFRFLPKFFGQLRLKWRVMRFRLGKRFAEEWRDEKTGGQQPSAFERTRTLDPEPVARSLDTAKELIEQWFPIFRNVRVLERWGGLIEVTPDSLPVISPVEKLPGCYVATGFSGTGFGIGLGAARVMADLVTAKEPLVDLRHFHLSRLMESVAEKPGTLN